MRNAPDILAGLMVSQYVDFLESVSMTCPTSPDIPVKVWDGGKNLTKGTSPFYDPIVSELMSLYHQDCLRKIR